MNDRYKCDREVILYPFVRKAAKEEVAATAMKRILRPAGKTGTAGVSLASPVLCGRIDGLLFE